MKEMWMKKRFVSLVMVLCIIMGVAASPVRMAPQAASKDVTRSISGKKKITSLTKCFQTPCGYDLIYKMRVGKTKKYNFSKASTRKYITKFCMNDFPGASTAKISKRLFGKSAPKVKAFLGDWGSEWPEIKIKKIYKLSSAKYRVDANVLWNEDNIRRYKIGTLKIYLKKKTKSHYGYIATSMVLKKTANL